MNYLVHLYLAGTEPEHRLGAIMGDFVKGRLTDSFPAGIRLGLQHHRRIDSLAHISVHTRQSRHRLNPRFGHTRAILVDIFYDHLLARHWENFSSESLEAFAAETYTLLTSRKADLPTGLQEILPRMMRHNWLVSYRDRDAIVRALDWISSRLSRSLPLADAVDEFALHEGMLKKDFEGFLQEALEVSQQEFGISA